MPEVALVGDPLARSVISALAYADLFDYPLTVEEIWRFQEATAFSFEEIELALVTSPDLRHSISRQGDYCCLRGREQVFEIRCRRAQESAQVWKRAALYARLLRGVPFVQMVAITGALAVDNISIRPDIDLLVVTTDGRVWIGRRLIIGLVHLARLFGDELCPNYVISAASLGLEQRDLFTAHELAQMVPLYGRKFHQEMIARNAWAHEYLPNAFGRPHNALPDAPRGVVRRSVEKLLSARWFARWERWEMRRLQAKLRPLIGDAAEVICSPQQCKGHTGLHRQRVTTRYAERLRELGL